MNKKELAIKEFESHLTKYQKAIKNSLPPDVPIKRFLSIAWNTVTANESLLDCHPQSLIGAIVKCAMLGLDPNIMNQAWIIPYKDKAVFVIGYEGMMTLMYRNPRVSKVICRPVYQGDEFEVAYGCDDTIKHIPKFSSEVVTHYYCVVTIANTHEKIFSVMTKKNVMDFAKKQPSWKKQSSSWHTDFDAMALKTVLRSVAKWVPKSVNNLVSIDYEAEDKVNEVTPEGIKSEHIQDVSEEAIVVDAEVIETPNKGSV